MALITSTACGFAGCVYPATEVEVRMDTDIDPRVPLVVTVRVTAGTDGDADLLGHTWRRIESAALDAGADDPPTDSSFARDAAFDVSGDASNAMTLPDVTAHGDTGPIAAGAPTPFPFHFFVIPAGRPHDSTVHLYLEARVGDVVVNRHAAFAFTPRAHTLLPLFISARCALPATSLCAGSIACTQSQYCEQQGQTCGDDGRCRSVESVASRELDGSFGDVGRGLSACGAYGEACCALGSQCDSPLSCVAGRCQRNSSRPGLRSAGADLVPDGTTCASTADPCKRAGTCTAGVCSPIVNAPDGTHCGTPVNACHATGICTSGVCEPGGVLPDGTPWGGGGVHRCCGGNPVSLDTASNCNACGLSCRTGACNYHSSIGQYLCACTANAQCSPLICRSSTYPDGLTCIPSDGLGNCTSACPGGSTCHSAHLASQPNYCYYP